ncbi:MAG: type I restriction endonuclease subunit R [Anaerolineales bacterium]|nr:type I restriction endonuclease subunit R [Anaerolineales bacterium]
MSQHGTETEFELTTLKRLEALGYQPIFGMELSRPRGQVVLVDELKAWLAKRYPDLPEPALETALHTITRPDGVDTLRRNLAFHQLLTRGFDLKIERPDGRVDYQHIYPIDWEHPSENEFWAVNQFPVHGQNDRRPDIVIFINGLPLVVFELKNPYDEKPTVEKAHNQIQHYIHDISQLFDFNAFVVVSDGVTTLHGVWTAGEEWYSPWKSIDGFEIEPNTTGSMKTLLEGLFPKERLLQYIRDFLVFEVVNEKITKKGARYHQFFAARLAAQKVLETYAGLRQNPSADRRVGVIWHTTGSGKSLSMAFLVGILRRRPELDNPIFVIEVDRNDLDEQLHDQFLAARQLVGDVRQAQSIADLRSLLQTAGGEIIFTTIEKFSLTDEERSHPRLNPRSNVILIADEAHRSQYGFKGGYARFLADALPNAMRLGFTGTPVSLHGADTVQVFGDLIHTYDIYQSQQDKATVPIYYEPRQIGQHLSKQDIETLFLQITAGKNAQEVNQRIGRWAALAAAARASGRMKVLARDLLTHYLTRLATLNGKAMIVCMERENCVRMYEALTALPDCPEIKIVMTGDLNVDPPEWSQTGYLTTKANREAIKQRMINPDDPLKMVIVCDMWLTGTDIPCLHTLYVDKPMEGHNMIQAVSRVNRVFRDKPHGLVVDYIGIGDALREATSAYTSSGGEGDVAGEIDKKARPLFFQALQDIETILPRGHRYNDWPALSEIELEDLYSLVYGVLTADDQKRDEFFQAEARLSSVFLLVMSLDDCRQYVDEVIFCQRVRKQLLKTTVSRSLGRELDRMVQDLVDDSLEPQGVVDIFKVAGIDNPDISILDDAFLQTFKDHPPENLQIKLLERLLADEIERRRKTNLVQTRSFKAALEKTLQEYHNRLIDAKAVIEQMIAIKQQMDASGSRAQELGLSSEEIAFYDAIASNAITIYDQELLRSLVKDVVRAVKRNLKVDWTEPHREEVHAAVKTAVRRVLARRGIRQEDLEPFLGSIMVQAEGLYVDWPLTEFAEIEEE